MNSNELIELIRKADPSGQREVWLMVSGDGRSHISPAESVGPDDSGDLVIADEPRE